MKKIVLFAVGLFAFILVSGCAAPLEEEVKAEKEFKESLEEAEEKALTQAECTFAGIEVSECSLNKSKKTANKK